MNRDDPNSSSADPTSDGRNDVLRDERDTQPIEGVSREHHTSVEEPAHRSPGRRLKISALLFALLIFLAAAAFLLGRHFVRTTMSNNLPRLDGTLTVYGLSAPVTVQRDAHGVPHIHASSVDDLVFAQGFVTAQDRLWQMDLLRRHAAGELAAILGRTMLEHDRLQRTLQLGAAAERALSVLPADQKHWLEVYARGVNASIVAQYGHLPLEFRLLGYKPSVWTPHDSLLVELSMFQDLTTGFPEKLGRESLAAHLSPDLIADLYPVGSWRDHPPGQPIPDITAPQPEFQDIPLDESQSKLRRPVTEPGTSTTSAADLIALEHTLALFHSPCNSCVAGSNAWAVSGSRPASGKPLRSAFGTRRTLKPQTPPRSPPSTPRASPFQELPSSSPVTTNMLPGASRTSAPICRTSTSSTPAGPRPGRS